MQRAIMFSSYDNKSRLGGFSLSVYDVYPCFMNSAELIKQMERAGWVLRGVKGSHHIFTHPEQPGHLSVPHPRKDLGVGLAHKLLKQAGLKE